MSKASFMRRARTSSSCISGCFTCNGSEAIWFSRNAMAVAARHHDSTGHPTWADQHLSVWYGDEATPTPKEQE